MHFQYRYIANVLSYRGVRLVGVDGVMFTCGYTMRCTSPFVNPYLLMQTACLLSSLRGYWRMVRIASSVPQPPIQRPVGSQEWVSTHPHSIGLQLCPEQVPKPQCDTFIQQATVWGLSCRREGSGIALPCSGGALAGDAHRETNALEKCPHGVINIAYSLPEDLVPTIVPLRTISLFSICGMFFHTSSTIVP